MSIAQLRARGKSGLAKGMKWVPEDESMHVLMMTDLEGCAGIFYRELQVSNAAPHEYAWTLRLCTREVIAAIEGARAAGADDILKAPVKWCANFPAARMLSPKGAQQTIRDQVERGLRRSGDIPLLAGADGPQEVAVRYVHAERADRSAHEPGARRIDAHTVAASVPSGRAIPALRFLFARPRHAEDAPTADEV